MRRFNVDYRVYFWGIFLLFSSLILSSCSGTSSTQNKDSLVNNIPEVPYADGVPLLPNVRPVLVLKGSDYDMGYQHAIQLIQIFGKYYLEGAANVKYGAAAMATIQKAEENIKKYTPWAIDYVRGMSDGCNAEGISMTYNQMLGHFVSPPSRSSSEVPECSGWVAYGSATKDGKLIAGGSGDHEMHVGSKYGYRYEINIMLFPETGNNFVFSPPSGGAGHPGMNNKGVVNAHHGTTNYFDRYKNPGLRNNSEGVPKVFALMHCLRFSDTANEVLNTVLEIETQQGGIWADINGDAFVIENKKNPQVVRRPGDHGERDFLYSTNNLFSKELEGAYDPLAPGRKLIFYPHIGYLGSEGSLGSIGRNFGLWNLLHNYHGEVDLEFAKMMWRFQGEPLPYNTIDEAIADYEDSQAIRFNPHISQPGNTVVAVLQPDNGNEGVIHVSHGVAVRGNNSPTWHGGVLVQLDPLYTFFELKLGANPAEVLKAARMRANYDLWNAYQELSKLDYADVRYSELNNRLNDAVTEWQKANFYIDEAGESESTGNKLMIKQAQAIRCLTRVQCYSTYISNVLIPPATRPEDLKLRSWHGSWGEWATRESGIVVKQY